MIVDSGMSRDDLVLAFSTSLVDGGWPRDWAEEVADDNIEIATMAPAGTIIVRRFEDLYVRGRYSDESCSDEP